MAAKMSGFNYFQSGKYGTLPQGPHKDMEVTQDMHLKMSKKIAQLTKVIYALNTKNDEHDISIQNMRDQHEEELQKLLVETKDKVAVYRAKINEELELRRKIERLESCILEHEKQQTEAKSDIVKYKSQAEQTENRLRTEHSQRILELSQEVLTAKKEFEEQLTNFEDLRNSYDLEKQSALDQLEQKHKDELEKLLTLKHSENSDWLSEKTVLENNYRSEINELKSRCDNLFAEKLKVVDDFELKLSKAQAFYEKELEALKHNHHSALEGEVKLLKEQHEKLLKDSRFQESELRKQVDNLLNKLSVNDDNISKYKTELEKLHHNLKDSEYGSSSLHEQVGTSKREALDALSRVRNLEADLAAFTERCTQQADDLLRKSSLIGELEATKLQNQSTLGDLRSEVSKLHDRLMWLESERKSLEREQLGQSEQQSGQLKALERALEELSIEKQTLMERYERDIAKSRQGASEREKELKLEHVSAIDAIQGQYQGEITEERRAASQLLAETRQGLETRLQQETSNLQKQRDAIHADFERVKADLLSKLQTAEEEVKRLDGLVQNSEQGLGSASTHINSLKDAANRLKTELDNARVEHKTERIKTATLQSELDKMRLIHESSIKEAQLNLKIQLEQLSESLDDKWKATLRSECLKLRSELTAQKDDENRAALQQTIKMKDEEMSAMRAGWEGKVHELLGQISKLKEQVQNGEFHSLSELQQLRSQSEAEKSKLRQEMLDAATEYAKKIDAMENMHNNVNERREQEMKELEAHLKAQHMADMKSQLAAHHVAIDSMKEQDESKRTAEHDVLRSKHSQQFDALRTELMHRHNQEMEEMMKNHNSELMASRMELERAAEISRQKDRDHSMTADELKSEITYRERHIKNLDNDLKSVQTEVDRLLNEVGFKDKEISKIRSEGIHNVRIQEDKLTRRHQQEMDNLSVDHIRESQEILTEFNRAQELLKDKISGLQIALEESEERYHLRNSRPEDLELIHQLRDAVTEREARVKQIIDEKRYYQMELVNRETNFNKVFNSTPNVGVMNPLNVKKRKGEKMSLKHTSAPSLNAMSGQRLDPLPGSPLHDEKLNPSRPLPQPLFTKKFIR